MAILDGVHRFHAALLRGDADIAVRFCDEPLEEAFVRTVRENVRHGLPLTDSDRAAAAGRILREHPHWSDRYVASVAGLSPRTVAELRKDARKASDTTHRLGRDGRMRPVDVDARRRHAAEILRKDPNTSLREIGRLAGISPTTARDVKRRVENGKDPTPERFPRTGGRDSPEETDRGSTQPHNPRSDADFQALVTRLCREPSLRHSVDGRLLLRLLDLHLAARRRSADIATAVPVHQAATVAAVAACCQEIWQHMATTLRTLRPGPSPTAETKNGKEDHVCC
ncbi:ParB/RepB/Spo0J family partition protein [Streptomyces chilikensis]|uniref:ParB/RepB/Spo0J family partition protein n=1 Tax=Streptomyces chilikensis TaxID=1194079 RepID=UPI00140B8290|nr:ParB/RepB/Spo0J family partition protein [Streptomyces chilikensis]